VCRMLVDRTSDQRACAGVAVNRPMFNTQAARCIRTCLSATMRGPDHERRCKEIVVPGARDTRRRFGGAVAGAVDLARVSFAPRLSV
jgi:hypothetical protein